ncbi:hypothetical protein MF672_039090 [Actinomadura sp. ATCC 31491]|uniref:Uncharacterized protein n=1 Tax=Actinomadura luzonensis TaxID=2805427 RepID=A0ABT0G576_9ACTN|nr:hypothetical protein [Actinomadura luzonensis]MCK2219761.1 hypothetical protein [Actinomadura luzonensis]
MAPIDHTGPGHPDVHLTLAEMQPDGGAVFQTWTICGCTVGRLRAHLGTPHQESVQTLESLRATGRAVLQTPGAIHLGEDL